MINILLILLKIIGIIIGTLIGILIILILIVLFVPIRYKVRSNNFDKIYASGTISWLLHIITLNVFYKEGDFSYTIRIFGFKMRLHDKNGKSQHTKDISKPDKKNEMKKNENSLYLENNNSVNITSEIKAKDKIQEEKSLIEKILSFFKNVAFTLRTFYDKMINGKDKIITFLEQIKKDSTKRAIILCKKQLMKILRMLTPRVFMLQLEIGLEDPCLLGELIGLYSVMYPIHKGKIILTPYFEEVLFRYSLFARGRIFIVTLLRVAIILYFDKDIKKLIREFNKEEK